MGLFCHSWLQIFMHLSPSYLSYTVESKLHADRSNKAIFVFTHAYVAFPNILCMLSRQGWEHILFFLTLVSVHINLYKHQFIHTLLLSSTVYLWNQTHTKCWLKNVHVFFCHITWCCIYQDTYSQYIILIILFSIFSEEKSWKYFFLK